VTAFFLRNSNIMSISVDGARNGTRSIAGAAVLPI